MALSKSQIWFLAARPKTLPAAMAPVIIGCTLAWDAHAFHLLSAIAALVGGLLIQIGTNFANDYFDFRKGSDEGDRLGPMRVTQAGLVSPHTMRRATILVFGLALLVGIYLVWRGGWPFVAHATRQRRRTRQTCVTFQNEAYRRGAASQRAWALVI